MIAPIVPDAEAEAGAFADFARGEEGIENPAEVLVGNAVARIGDEQLDSVGLGNVARADADLPRRPRPHRLFGVQQQVEQRLLELAAVAEDRGQAGLELGLQLDRLQAELIGAQRQHPAHEVGDVLFGARGRLAARRRAGCARSARRARTLRRCAAVVRRPGVGRVCPGLVPSSGQLRSR